MSEHSGAQGVQHDDRVARVVEAARRLVEAYRQQSTAQDHFERLASALEALDGDRGGGASAGRTAEQSPRAQAVDG